MEPYRKEKIQRIIPAALILLHLALHVILGISGKIQPFELFNLLLLAANIAIGTSLSRGKGHLIIGMGVMAIIASHAIIGHKVAPDSLTSGALLMINILTFYTGYKIYEALPRYYILVFAASYGLLFVIFILMLENAQSLFLLALFGLCGAARKIRRQLIRRWSRRVHNAVAQRAAFALSRPVRVPPPAAKCRNAQ